MNQTNSKEDILGHTAKQSREEQGVMPALCEAFTSSSLSLSYKLQGFSRHVRRQDVARFLTKYELFKLSLQSNGSIVECGVFTGAGIFNWLHFSSILEPYNHTRKIIGFDTFSGFPSIDQEDLKTGGSQHLHQGGLSTSQDIEQEINNLAALHDRNRPLGHIPKVQLVAGDASETIPQYVAQNPHLLISLIYLDFDIYKPTKVALDNLYSRVVKGGVVAFDELNCPEFPGETAALMEHLDMRKVKLQRFPHDPYISYFIKE